MGYSCISSKYVDQLIHSIIFFESKELQICCCLSSTCGSPSFMGFMNYHFSLLDLFYIIRHCNRKWDLLVPPHAASQQGFLDQCMPVCLWWDRQIIASGEKEAHKKYSLVLHKPMVSLLKQSDLQVMCAVWKINLSISLTVFTLNKNKIDGWKNIKICAACLIYFQSFQKYM